MLTANLQPNLDIAKQLVIDFIRTFLVGVPQHQIVDEVDVSEKSLLELGFNTK